MKKFTVLSTLLFVLSSCMTLHQGYLSPLSQNVDESEFRYVKTVSGEASVIYLLLALFNDLTNSGFSSLHITVGK